MPRFPRLLWAACLGSAAIASLPGCMAGKAAPAATGAIHQAHQASTYDAYYGQPPRSRGQVGKLGTPDTRQPLKGMGSIEIQPNAPTTYVVKKGDTLWGIAQKYLKTPGHWPELWDQNQSIANPHHLRPGDVLHFGYEPANGHGQESTGLTGAGGDKLLPRIRVERSGNQGEPLSTLASLLEWPRIMQDDAIRTAPYLLASRDNNSLMVTDETAYIKNIRQPRLGGRYAIYHPDKPVYDPETQRMLGHQVTYNGYARLERIDTISTIKVLDVDGPIRSGDRLLPVDGRHAELRAPIQIPPTKIRGQIAALYDAEYLGASSMIIAINRGKQHGLKPGFVVGVYADGNTIHDRYDSFRGNAHSVPVVTLPPEKVANAIVYSVHDNLSYALITESGREVKNGDKIGNP